MDLHDVIENLHKGKKAIQLKENSKSIIEFSELSSKDPILKNNLFQHTVLVKEKFPSIIKKEGFIITSNGIKDILIDCGIYEEINSIISRLSKDNLHLSSKKIQKILLNIKFNELIEVQISRQINQLNEVFQYVELHSSLWTEFQTSSNLELTDVPNIHYNLKDIMNDINNKIKELFSLENLKQINEIDNKFPNSCISYELLLKNIKKSGTISSIEYTSGHESILSIHSNYGLFAYKFHNLMMADFFEIFKYSVKEGKKGIFKSQTNLKKEYLSNSMNINTISKQKKNAESLNAEEINKLSKVCIDIEDYLSKVYKEYFPIRLHFSILENNVENKTIIIDSVFSEKKHLNLLHREIQSYELLEKNKEPILSGECVNHSIVHGKVKLIHSEKDLINLNSDDIVVINTIKPEYLNYFSNIKGLVSMYGDEFSLSSKFCYEYGIPGIINCSKNPIQELKNGEFVTLDCSNINAKLFRGLIKYKIQQIPKNETHNYLTKKVYEETLSHNYLIKSKFPNNGRILYSLFEEIDFSLDLKSIKLKIVENISKIAISKFPQPVWISVGQEKEIITLLNKKHSSQLCSKIGIQRVIDVEYEEILKFELDCIKYIKDEIGCKNVNIMINNVQEEKEIKLFKQLIDKYSKNLSIGAQVSMGGLVLSKEISKYTTLIAISLNELRLACGRFNTQAISNYIHFFLENLEKTNCEKLLLNVDLTDFDLIEDIYHSKIDSISTRHENFLEVYSAVSQIQNEKKIKHSKHKTSKISKKK